MHPAYSVIFFTTASGAGYGLLVWLSLLALSGRAPLNSTFGILAFLVALGLISAGLLSSTFHLGRPERAWRAFSQWRSSWLSREGVAAVVTYVPALMFAFGWVMLNRTDGVFGAAAVLSAIMALVTVYMTGMIYASLKTIRAWHDPIVPTVYILMAIATGGVLVAALLALFGALTPVVAVAVALCVAAAGLIKAMYWARIDGAAREFKVGAATGLGRFGEVRPLDPPHSRPNFVMREMGYSIARKHAAKLRKLAVIGTFFVPIVCMVLAAMASSPVVMVILSLVALASASAGVATERWLFFAEAEHVVMLYYGRQEA